MPLNIKDDEIHEVARKLAELKKTSITAAVREALFTELERTEAAASRERSDLAAALDEIAVHAGKLPLLDDRSPDEILGYDASGLPT
jgi:antitoxin VapB